MNKLSKRLYKFAFLILAQQRSKIKFFISVDSLDELDQILVADFIKKFRDGLEKKFKNLIRNGDLQIEPIVSGLEKYLENTRVILKKINRAKSWIDPEITGDTGDIKIERDGLVGEDFVTPKNFIDGLIKGIENFYSEKIKSYAKDLLRGNLKLDPIQNQFMELGSNPDSDQLVNFYTKAVYQYQIMERLLKEFAEAKELKENINKPKTRLKYDRKKINKAWNTYKSINIEEIARKKKALEPVMRSFKEPIPEDIFDFTGSFLKQLLEVSTGMSLKDYYMKSIKEQDLDKAKKKIRRLIDFDKLKNIPYLEGYSEVISKYENVLDNSIDAMIKALESKEQYLTKQVTKGDRPKVTEKKEIYKPKRRIDTVPRKVIVSNEFLQENFEYNPPISEGGRTFRNMAPRHFLKNLLGYEILPFSFSEKNMTYENFTKNLKDKLNFRISKKSVNNLTISNAPFISAGHPYYINLKDSMEPRETRLIHISNVNPNINLVVLNINDVSYEDRFGNKHTKISGIHNMVKDLIYAVENS